MILYKGPSCIDGNEIVCLATGLNGSKNRKTGPMVQTYILLQDMPPREALQTGADVSICGNCPARNTWCYAIQGHSGMVLSRIYRHWRSGGYAHVTDPGLVLKDRLLRLGAYGDPAAVPTDVWRSATRLCRGWTGYTHQWRDCDQDLKEFCMASVDSIDEALEAQALGWRTYRVTESLDVRLPREVPCPHGPTGLQCSQCLACDGTRRSLRGSIVIEAHGSRANKFREFNRLEATNRLEQPQQPLGMLGLTH